MRKRNPYKFMWLLVRLTDIVSDFVCFVVTYWKISGYEHLIHSRTFGVTSSYRQHNKLAKLFFVVMVSLIAGTWPTEPALCQEVNLAAIAQVESGGNPKAVGDGGKALGLFQAHQSCVSDVNKLLGTKYTHRDVLDRKVAVIVANAYLERVIPAYLKHYRLPDTLENRLTAYNMGIGAVVKGRIATSYIKKYKEAL